MTVRSGITNGCCSTVVLADDDFVDIFAKPRPRAGGEKKDKGEDETKETEAV